MYEKNSTYHRSDPAAPDRHRHKSHGTERHRSCLERDYCHRLRVHPADRYRHSSRKTESLVLISDGLNLGYDFLNKSDRWRLELNASGGTTYLKTPYRFAYADLNLKFGTKYLGAYNAYLSIGLRYISPYNPDMTQKLMFNFSIGFFAF